MKFHGHLCPGLALGYKSSILAMHRLKEKKVSDEEIIGIVENDSCFVDAVQVITGCTFGKGNIFFKDYGKMALTLLSRNTKRGLRVALKSGVLTQPQNMEIFSLMDKVLSGNASMEEKRLFEQFQLERAVRVLKSEPEEIFSVREVEMELPPSAKIMKSEICGGCGEPVMVKKLVEINGSNLCIPCAQKREFR
ncbi:MAG: FmdE family protein [Deltaproteobacteria bacterium]|nr:FmdE family protein [Deltaproteobacteria bacterium]